MPSVSFFLKQNTILINLALVTVVWVTATFNFFMINLQVKYFPGSFEQNMLVMTMSDMPACALAGFMVVYYRPKTIFVVFNLLASFAGLSMIFLIDPKYPGFHFPLLVSGARVGTIGLFTAVWLCHPQMFPTLFAVTSMGIANIFSRGLVILAPLIAEIEFPFPIVIFTALSIICGISSCFIIDGEKLKML